ncbi:MAG: methyltransferase domain-containing protein [Gammaproteobacteria bacterium]|nr:methyltransferase domain-containing protein [Gammaproteobacteria bacterium]
MARIVEGIELRGKRVLEPGSGAAGGTIALARNHSANVVGLELEAPLVKLSRELAAEAGYADQVEFRCVKPGPLPVDDNSFDHFYTSGVVCHIEDKQSLFEDVFRALKPGGWVLGYDWFVIQPNAAIDSWMQASNLHLFTSSLQEYTDALRAAGFDTISSDDASDWYLKQAANELTMLQGPWYDQAAAISNPEIRDNILHEWQCLNAALATGDFRQGYFRGRKPD